MTYESTNDTNVRMVANKKIVGPQILHAELSYEIVGSAFEVHNELGQFAREKQYGDLLEKKLKEKGLGVERELRIGESGNIVDFLIEKKVLLELKAKPALTRNDYRQLQHYLHETTLRLGILLNFRNRYLKPIRVVRIDQRGNGR